MPDRDDKIYDPTPQRLERAREEGNVFKSQEILSVGLLTTAAVLIIWGMPYAFDTLQRIMQRLYLGAAQSPLNMGSIQPLLAEIGLRLGFVLIPFFVVLALVSAGLSVAQTGWNVTFKPLEPKPSRLNPFEGIKRIFSKKGLFNLFKSLVKIVVAGPVAYFVLEQRLPQILTLHTLPVPSIIESTTNWIVVLLAYILLALLVLSVLDFAFEKWKHKQDLKMTKQEMEEEQKQQEGDPEMKSRRREKALEFAKQPRMDHAVMNADVVVTNPTHYAVALSYDPELAEAPRVLLKGMRKRALRIKQLAADFDVPVREDPPLARALYASVPEQEEIPEELYQAVAVILAEVYRDESSRA